MSPHSLAVDRLNEAGLNRQAIFNLADLPADIREKLAPQAGERQLILLGHGGRRLWECVTASAPDSEHPIDDYCVATVRQLLADYFPDRRYRILYPGDQPIGLQALGQLAGWHHPSPFMIGVDAQWGSWHAYRAAILSDSDFPAQAPVDRDSAAKTLPPCQRCAEQACIATCPAGALADGKFDLARCSTYRLQPNSPCAFTCLARLACPVGSEHRYDAAQLHHSYSRSLQMIRQYG